MGNHATGTAIGLASIEAVRSRKPGESALSILDRLCTPYRGDDAEFESMDPNKPDYVHPECDDWRYPHRSMALGMLMLEAFAPNGIDDLARYHPMLDGEGVAQEDAWAAWKSEVCDPFSDRYYFC